ncbi:MAG: 2-oxoglutarate dehydrogenase complex dihydrolipoyllysine-residue succinyltransferase [Gammaproteobacteria bacterium]|jgi:2-oxoglutarate dehydrogenase E2 component (dihydrolipoamide succinyltransferase)
MLVDVKVPVLAESVTEGTLASWNKKQGEHVRRNENLVDMETDKVMLEIVAPQDGVLKEIIKPEGETVGSSEVIAVIDTEGDAAADSPHTGDIADNIRPIKQPVETQTGEAANEPAPLQNVAANNGAVETEATNKKIVDDLSLSPAVRKLVNENQIDPHSIKGTGKDGRIVKGDVLEYLDHMKSSAPRPQTSAASTQQAQPAIEPAPQAPQAPSMPQAPQPVPEMGEEERPEKRVPMSRLRQRVAQRLKEAQNTAAILTTFNEINMKPVMDLRNRYKQAFQERHNVKLGFMSFFAKAVVEALKQFPVINATMDGEDIIYHGYYDIGIAVGSPRGLVVPILRNVDTMSFADVEIAVQDYGKRARDGKLSLDELTGGTFSISNGGVYGSMLSTPILNPPQSAILGMHNIVERPVVENGEIVIRPMMYVALSYDHRIIDGHDAVLFLVTVKQIIEDPTRILLDI